MAKIQELSERLANQIAAGEVVERPASVVKELVENAIDAGATQIDILIEEAGLKKIQITDNGEGIEADDVLNAFKRHATSKLHDQHDLFRIRTLGFRGEALPSVASVSELTLETAVQTETQGTFLQLRGGDVVEQKPTALRQGTKITVENLFFNTPARLKYVKTIQTELSNVTDIVNRMALSHPDIAFRLFHDGHKLLTTAGNGDLKQTIAGIYGLATAKKMLPIAREDLDFKVSGYISLPEVTRASRNYLSTIINGRFIKNFALNQAIVAGYGSKLMVGRFPIAVIEIEMDPLLVDVNVHPTKQEVRLSKEKELTALIKQAIEVALHEEILIPSAVDNLSFKKKIPKEAQGPKPEQIEMALPIKSQDSGKLNFDPASGNFFVEETPESLIKAEPKTEKSQHEHKEPALSYPQVPPPSETAESYAPVDSSKDEISVEKVEESQLHSPQVENEEASTQENPQVDKTVVRSTAETKAQVPQTTTQDFSEIDHPEFELQDKKGQKELEQAVACVEKETDQQIAQRFPELEYFGQMHGTYLFAQSNEGLYIIDQHAAQERIKYEYFREKIGEVSDDLQELLLPIVLDYPNSDALKLQEHEEELQQVGIFLEEFGQNSFIIRTHPTWFPQGEEEAIIREMLDIFLTTGSISVKKFREATAIMMSCKRSIKANHYLNEAQARVLLEDLKKCENPFNCPHGRPVLVHFTNYDMERMFKRIQDPH